MEFVGKLDKKDKKVLIWGFIVGTILNIFIHKAREIVIMLVMLYFLHKNFDVNKFTENMEFINKEKYIEGLNKIIRVFDIYIAIKIILTLVTQMGGFNAMEFALVGEFDLIYNGMLARKYVKSIDNVEVERNRKLIKNKILTAVILIGFVGFTCNYLNKLEFKENYINSPKYKYELTYDKEKNKSFTYGLPYNKCSYSGTGDIFVSIVCGLITNNYDLDFAVKTASDFIYKCVSFTSKYENDRNQGVMFEMFLNDLTSIDKISNF